MKTIVLLLSLFATNVYATCSQFYPYSKKLVVTNTIELCNSFYVTVFNTKENRVVFTSEKLVGTMVGTTTRNDSFRSDKRISNGPSNSDYQYTGLDRGHMVPADDASTDIEARDTFLLTNMTPQEPTLNRKSWKVLEDKVRDMHYSNYTDTTIMTIAVYDSPQYMGRIPKPTGYWKIVYKDNWIRYFYADNIPDAKVVERSNVIVNTLIR